MDQLNILNGFFLAIQDDGRISITHIGIYAALLQCRIASGFANPIQVFSHEVMKIAKISASITYYKCVKELSAYGYIHYMPSFKRNQASRIYFLH
ncbi:hypothetical protein [Parafilimonas sp.]|uniref:hypothetical protein n=1 Tax=Parafilimonas sp. TaxID=1969739 RepID=UPI0039E6B2A4